MRKFQLYGKVNMRIDDPRGLPLLDDSICADDVTFEQGFAKFISRKNFGEHQCVYAISTDYVGLITTSVDEPKNAVDETVNGCDGCRKPHPERCLYKCEDALFREQLHHGEPVEKPKLDAEALAEFGNRLAKMCFEYSNKGCAGCPFHADPDSPFCDKPSLVNSTAEDWQKTLAAVEKWRNRDRSKRISPTE